MDLKKLMGITACGLLGMGSAYYAYTATTAKMLADLEASAGIEQIQNADYERKNLYGDYLGSQFAQQHHDWKRAGDYLDEVMKQTPDDPLVLKRAMILAMGAGDWEQSVGYAKQVAAHEKDNALAMLFMAAGALHEKNYAQADKYLKTMPEGSLSEFITPLLLGWTEAGIGQYHGEKLTKNIIHLHHAILIADYLKKNDEIEKLLTVIMATQTPTAADLERIADIYAHIGNKEKARELYEAALKEWPDNPNMPKKLAALQAGQDIPFDSIDAPEQGVAMALYNMAQILYQEYADESARVFANVALYLDPSMTDAKLLLAAITSRNDRTSDAIQYYRAVPVDSEYYLESRRRAADLLEDSRRTDEALAELSGLVKDHNDVESLIRIGDIYRRQEDFPKALETYNQAASRFGEKIPREYWHLLYARGMSLERLGQWDKAESDLKTALSYQPDQPYVLNYLAYAWTDQGVNLPQALDMLKKASELRPSDGYITDSLGWVYYRLGRYRDAVPVLEAAVELLPYDPTINDHLGDAYWQAGRKLEARFQWNRAKNYSSDAHFIGNVEMKLSQGLQASDNVKQAHHTPPEDTAIMKP
jgi:tetratricopeptide (TPR) repeat protein